MKKAAPFLSKLILAVVLITVAALVSTKSTWAASGNTQICAPSESCTIGEFVYTDSYVAENSATCTITSRYPDGTAFLSAQALTHASQNDGWYSHTFTAPSTLGLYRTTITCIVSAETMTLDKTFEVKEEAGSSGSSPTADEIAEATWSYSSRSLSSFGSLVADVWAYASRTLTGAGLTSGSLATKDDVTTYTNTTNITNNITNIGNTAQETRNLLEQLVNKPIIETTAEEDVDLDEKITLTEKKINQLSSDTRSANSNIDSLVLKWSSLSESKIIDGVEGVNKKFGGENDKETAKSMFGSVNYLAKSWDWKSIEDVNTQLKIVRDLSFSLQNDLESKGKTTASLNKARVLGRELDQFEVLVGNKSSKSNENNLFGKLNQTKSLSSSFDAKSKEVKAVLAKWEASKFADKKRKIGKISNNLLVINKIPGVRKSLLTDTSKDDKELKNKSYYMLGIIETNKKLLAKKSGSALTNTWLELGSIVFKSIASNPSTYLSQDVDLKYYLPPEIKKEHILEVDEGMEVKYDAEKDQYFVVGSYYLAPSESITLSVRTEDIWVIKQAEIDSLRKQAEELSKPLERTSFFAQGVTLKTDIDVSLDKVENSISSITTPESKIRSYREAQIELKAAKEKIDKLKDLTTQAGSAGALFGFVGGTQTLAVWGLILILMVGFVSITVYMRVLTKKEKRKTKSKGEALSVKGKEELKKSGTKLKYAVGLSMLVILVIGTVLGGIGGVLISKAFLMPQAPQEVAGVRDVKVLGAAIEESNAKAQEEESDNETNKEKSDVDSEEDLDVPDTEELRTITVSETPTGFLNVRKTPGGLELAKVNPGDTFTVADENNGWFQIILEDGSSGWVSGKYVVESPLNSTD